MKEVPFIYTDSQWVMFVSFFIKMHNIVNKSVFVLNPFDNIDSYVKFYPTFKSLESYMNG